MKTTEQDRYGAVEKCRAVLAVWTERTTAAVLCRELGVSGALFSQWQDRALSGILEALEPRGTRAAGSEGSALPAQFKRLLDRKSRARELELVGRGLSWRTRPVRSRVLTPPSAAATP
jgi:transposase-like protein